MNVRPALLVPDDAPELRVLPAHACNVVRHALDFPDGTRYDLLVVKGKIGIRYKPIAGVLDGDSLATLIGWGLNRDDIDGLEAFAAWLLKEIVSALGWQAQITIDVVVMPGPQKKAITIGYVV